MAKEPEALHLETCPAVVSQDVCVEAHITVHPFVKPGTPTLICVDPVQVGCCSDKHKECAPCTFTVHQRMCIQIPLTFGATAAVKPGSAVCAEPSSEPCLPQDCD